MLHAALGLGRGTVNAESLASVVIEPGKASLMLPLRWPPPFMQLTRSGLLSPGSRFASQFGDPISWPGCVSGDDVIFGTLDIMLDSGQEPDRSRF